jgi:hypothetical protein
MFGSDDGMPQLKLVGLRFYSVIALLNTENITKNVSEKIYISAIQCAKWWRVECV